jgi:hypothetical protein
LTTTSIIAVIFVFVIIKHGMDTKAKQDRERLRLIEEALRQGNLDDKSREELMGTLTGRKPQPRPDRAPAPRPRSPHDVGFFLKFLAFIGWLGFCVGMSFVIVVANFREYEFLAIPATILSCSGFGLVTFPFVIRELNSPRRGIAAEQRT